MALSILMRHTVLRGDLPGSLRIVGQKAALSQGIY